jgi:hypothetical protein
MGKLGAKSGCWAVQGSLMQRGENMTHNVPLGQQERMQLGSIQTTIVGHLLDFAWAWRGVAGVMTWAMVAWVDAVNSLSGTLGCCSYATSIVGVGVS